MLLSEPYRTALLLMAAGVLMAAAVVASRASGRLGIPIPLVFLGVGVLAGSEGIARLPFDDYHLAFRLGAVALVLILFDGGLNTTLGSVKRAAGPGGALATVGVVLTAGITGVGAHYFAGLSWRGAMLMGAVVSSTDAASVFSVLRGTGVHLRPRVGNTIELESGLNDPMAVILTTALAESLARNRPLGGALALEVGVQLAVGAGLGVILGRVWLALLRRLPALASGLYPVLTTALAFLAFGLATVLHGSGFLAVYAAAIVLGNGRLPYRTGILRVHDAVAWMSQVSMFLVLGLLVYPSRLAAVALPALGIALLLAFVARPLAALACLAPFRFSPREIAFVGWVGLRGAVPIVLATVPVLAGVREAGRIFDAVFFVVVVSTLAQGGSLRAAANWLRVAIPGRPVPHAALEIVSTRMLEGELVSFYIDEAAAVVGSAMADVPFPADSAALLMVRGDQLIAPRGATVFAPGDHVFVFCRREDLAMVQLMFGRNVES